LTVDTIYKELNYVDHSREKRSHYANLLLNDPSLMRPLLEILFLVDDPLSARAGWVIEFVVKKDVTPILPHLDYFITMMPQVYKDQALRPVSKICETLIFSYYKKKDQFTREALQTEHRKQITETSFDWQFGCI